MKALKRWMTAAVAVALLGVAPGSVFAQTPSATYFNFSAVDEGGVAYTGQDVNCSVTRPQTHGYVTLHQTSALIRSSGGVIWSDASGRLHFYTASSDPVDVSCAYAGGGSFTGRLRSTDHKIIIPRQGYQIARFSVSTSAATYQSNSGIVLPAGAVLYDVVIQNNNPQGLGTYHLSVGFLGNHAGAQSNTIVNAQALSSPNEWLRPHVTGDFVTNHRGALLSRSHGSGVGSYYEIAWMQHFSSGVQISYSAQPGVKGAAGSNFLNAHVFLLWKRFHSVGNNIPFGLGR